MLNCETKLFDERRERTWVPCISQAESKFIPITLPPLLSGTLTQDGKRHVEKASSLDKQKHVSKKQKQTKTPAVYPTSPPPLPSQESIRSTRENPRSKRPLSLRRDARKMSSNPFLPTDQSRTCWYAILQERHISPTPPHPISLIPPKKENQKATENGAGPKTGAERDVGRRGVSGCGRCPSFSICGAWSYVRDGLCQLCFLLAELPFQFILRRSARKLVEDISRIDEQERQKCQNEGYSICFQHHHSAAL